MALPGAAPAQDAAVSAKSKPVTVPVAQVRRAAVPLLRRALGTVVSPATVAVRARTDGEIVQIHFREGQEVKAGDPLFTLDSRAQRAALAQAEANLGREQAELNRARREVMRYQPIASSQVVARQKVDELAAEVAVREANLRAAEAAIAAVRVPLSYTDIRAPISGRTGTIALTLGNMAKADGAPLVTLHQVKPIQIAFSLPQRDLPLLRTPAGDAPRRTVTAELTGDPGGPIQGLLSFIDSAVDRDTGTVLLKADFANDDERLRPGQLANLALVVRTDEAALVVPETAVQQGQAGPWVYVVEADSRVAVRPIRQDRIQAGLVVVGDGLAVGEIVVVDGQFRLSPGALVAADQGAKP